MRDKVHKLGQQLGFNRRNFIPPVVEDPEYVGAHCPLCEKFGLTAGLKFVDLREWKPRSLHSTRRSLFDGESSNDASQSTR
jgi:hypothetical protein